MSGLPYLALLVSLATIAVVYGRTTYRPTWESLDKRPLPAWYDEAKFGIFLHWGVFSVPSFGASSMSTAWFWWYWKGQGLKAQVDFMKKNYPPGFSYADFAPKFTAEFFDPNQWADIFAASGAKYVVLTSKHHEGFTNWGSPVSWNWNSVENGPHRDLVGDLANAIRNRTSIHFGLYHSMYEWFNPLYIADKKNNYKTQDFVRRKTMPELFEIVNKYHPEVIWSDGEWDAPDTYWNSTNFLAWLYNESPVRDIVVANDRWGNTTRNKHGGVYTGADRFDPGKLLNHKWENAMTVDKYSWGFRRDAKLEDFLTMDDLTGLLAETVSCGGNLLMNIGPTHDGRIAINFQETLRNMGKWLKVNGDAIYASRPWKHQNDTQTKGIWYTSKSSLSGTDVYAIFLDWPQGNQLLLGAVKPTAMSTVSLLGYSGEEPLMMEMTEKGLLVVIPKMSYNEMPCDWAWTLKFTNLFA